MSTLDTIRTHISQSPAHSAESLLFVLGALPLPIVWFRLDNGDVIFLNRAFEQVFGYDASEVRSWSHWSSRFPDAAQRETAVNHWLAQTRKRTAEDAHTGLPVEEMEIQALARDDRELTVLHSGVVLPALNCALAIYIDITERKSNEVRLADAERSAREREVLYPILLQHTHEMIIISSSDGTRRFVSPAVQAITGWTADEYQAQRIEDMVHPDDREHLMETRQRCMDGATGEQIRYRARQKDGSWLWLDGLASCYSDPATGKPLGYVAMIRDASSKHAEELEREARTALLEQQARFDQLTGVANRHVLYSRLQDEATHSSPDMQQLSLLLVDVDHFKRFNDYYGHVEGDRVLQRVAASLQIAANRSTDLVARFGGEEFAILLPATGEEGAERIARNILALLTKQAIPHSGSAFGMLTVSIGIVCWPPSRPFDREQMLIQADRALYRAKRSGRNNFSIEHSLAPSSNLPHESDAAGNPIDAPDVTDRGTAPFSLRGGPFSVPLPDPSPAN